MQVGDDRLQFLAEQPAFLFWSAISIRTVSFSTDFADGHGAGQGVQNADLDGFFGGVNG